MPDGANIEGQQEFQQVNKRQIAGSEKPPEIPITEKPEAVNNFENDPEIIERVDPKPLVKKINDCFHVPTDCIEQGEKSEIFILKNEGFDRVRDEQKRALGISEDEIAEEGVEEVGGFTSPLKEGGSMIFIKDTSPFNRKHDETHELIHAMSEDVRGDYGGFNRRIEAAMGYQNNNLNEAVTEILTLAVEYPGLSIKEITNRIANGEIEVGYDVYVLKMLIMMNATSRSEQPFGISELAKYYFHDFKGEKNASDLLKEELVERVDPESFDQSAQWLYNDLKDAEIKTT